MSTKNTAGENFLLPNGTFFAELLIFVTVLGVIWRFVIPPINRAMEEREARVAKTEADERAAAGGAPRGGPPQRGAGPPGPRGGPPQTDQTPAQRG